MWYTECSLQKFTHTMLDDFDKDTVDFQENFDSTEQEPSVLPARFPNLLVKGAGEIAVGMDTNIPLHNLGKVIDTVVQLIDYPELYIPELIIIIPLQNLGMKRTGIRNRKKNSPNPADFDLKIKK